MISRTSQKSALSFTTIAFTACFAVWTIFAIIGVQIKQDLGLSETEFSLLIATPILAGSLVRLILGIWADQYGGRPVFLAVMLSSAFFTWCLTFADSYGMMLLTALGIGLAGGSFVVGVSYISKLYEKERQGTALGLYGMGNIGAAVTKLLAPFVMVSYGWHMVAQVWAVALVVIAVLFWIFTKDEPQIKARKEAHAVPKSMAESLKPLGKLQVWRFSLYYFFVFGGFVALALWLPRYYVGVYDLDIETAGVLAAFFSIAGSVFRAYGGHLSDKYGARSVMYWTFAVCAVCCFLLSYPETDYVVHGIDGDFAFSFGWGVFSFTVILFVLGFFMSLGKAAVFKHIPVYYPDNVGSVAGIVGLIGGLGGFVLPICFGLMTDYVNIPSSAFMLMFLLVAVAFLWMHVSIRLMERRKFPEIVKPHFFTELEQPGPVLKVWKPEDEAFWKREGYKIARRNLWLSVPALFLAFALWMVWSVVVVNLPAIGFAFTTEQLFWLTALPGLSGATLRIFYSFMVPIFGGRRWTAISTALLLLPTIGIGIAVQDPTTPYPVFLILALLCGLGGGNFASSMSNIAFFFPKREKGNALALNAGLGNLGVSAVQFLVPIVVVYNIFGGLAGAPQQVGDTELWVQNAAFLWVPFIILSAVLAWYFMNDIADVRASVASQMAIFERKHNWIMCVLYIGTFGSFIGFSAAFPLLAKSQFPDVNSLQLAFIGPLVGALTRAGSGWAADKYGGGRVTLGVFVAMILGTVGVLYFLGIKDQPYAFYGFFAMFLLLFAATGVGNASTFQMIPVIFWQDRKRALAGEPEEEIRKAAERESAAVIGFSSAIGAFGAFFIPQSYGMSIASFGTADVALYIFIAFYALCLFMTWYFYTRKGADVKC
ncbi:nitrate/nitrite transporter [Sneathiella sp.]|uniref:nitrate/nitrite transporter n=1 Tax=Sneathiella sp. TaxID=1964365 RepID=UPI002FE21243